MEEQDKIEENDLDEEIKKLKLVSRMGIWKVIYRRMITWISKL